MPTEVPLTRNLGQRVLSHQVRAQAGQVAFGMPGVAVEEPLGNEKPEQRIAQVFQPLVVMGSGTSMGQGLVKIV